MFDKNVEKATQLHHELEDLVQNHLQRARVEAATPAHQSFASFLYKNKREMMNIVIAFVGTIFAYQIAGLRRYGNRLENEIKEKELELQDAQALLRSLTQDEFVRKTVDAIKYEIQMDDSENRSSSTWFRRRNEPDHSEVMATVIQKALQKRIGDAGLSADEKRDRVMEKLKNAQDDLLQQQQQLPTNSSATDDSDILAVWEESTGEQVVKKRRFSI